MLRDKNIVDSVDYDKALECFEKAVLLGKKKQIMRLEVIGSK